jgi:hypothetical protein
MAKIQCRDITLMDIISTGLSRKKANPKCNLFAIEVGAINRITW